jgi:hypothetical protein
VVRTFVGAAVGFLTGIRALAVWGFVIGLANGIPSRRDLTPGLEAGVVTALFYSVFFGCAIGPIGFAIGGLAGLGSALVSRVVRRARFPENSSCCEP